MQEIVKEIRDVLSEVKYPGTSKSIVALDMVQNIKAEDGKVDFRLVFQKSNDPFVGAVSGISVLSEAHSLFTED